MSARSLWHWLDGSVRVRVTGGLGERFLNDCARLGAVIEDVRAVEFGFEFDTSPADVKLMRAAARRRRCEFAVVARRGAPFRLRRLRGRFGLALGAALAVFILLWEPRAVWSIDFYDFTPAEEKQMRALLYEHGVCEGVLADVAQMNVAESEILSGLPQYGWLQFNFVHGRLVVEKTDGAPAPEMQTQEELTVLVAACDGIVRGFDLMGGYIEVEPGQAVARGELLVNAATVGKRTGKVLYSAARGHVLAETRRVFRCFIPYELEVQAQGAVIGRSASLITPLGRLPLGEQTGEDGADVSVTAQPLTVFGLHLPATLETRTVRRRVSHAFSLTARQAADIARSRIHDALNDAFDEYEILARDETVEEQEAGVLVTLRYTVLADIAESAPYTVDLQPEIPADAG